MDQTTINLLLLTLPLLVGGTVAALNSSAVNDAAEKIEAWIKRTQLRASTRGGWFFGYLLNPLLWLAVKFADWSDSLAHGGVKNGVRVAATLYLIAAWGFLLYVAVAVAFTILMFVAALYLLSLIFGDSSSSTGSNEEVNSLSERPPIGPRGTRLVKEGIFFDTPTGDKVTEDGRIVKEGILFDTPSGMRIDDEGRLVEECIFFDTPTGTKMNSDGRIVEEGLLFDSPTGTKIDADGRVVEEGILFDSPTGMQFKK